MALYSFTPANVLATGATPKEGVAGAAIDAGDILYKDTAASDVLKLAQCDSTAPEAEVAGIAVNSAALGQPVQYAASGEITVNAATFSAGALLVLGTAPGQCMDAGDLLATHRISIVGWATATDKFELGIANTGVVKA